MRPKEMLPNTTTDITIYRDMLDINDKDWYDF